MDKLKKLYYNFDVYIQKHPSKIFNRFIYSFLYFNNLIRRKLMSFRF